MAFTAFLILLIAVFIPLPQRKISSSFCIMKYPDGGCTANYKWQLGPSIFEQLTNKELIEKRNPTNKPDAGRPTPAGENEKACGGFIGETGVNACTSGYYCRYPEPMYPDAQGVCVKK